MKLTFVAIAFLLAPLFLATNFNKRAVPQEPKTVSDLDKLEAQFKQLDEDPKVKVDLRGDKESSASLKATVGGGKRSIVAGNKENARVSPNVEAEKVVTVDLSSVQVSDAYVDQKLASIFSNPNPVGTLSPVKVMKLEPGVIYEVLESYTYDSGHYRITVPQGFRYDRATIPRIFWVLIDKDSLSNVAPLFHDYLYQHGGVLPANQVSPYRKFSRKDTDDLFLELMTKSGVNNWRRKAAYQAVRNFSESYWKQN